MPAKRDDDHRRTEIRRALADVMRDTENAVIRRELALREPLGKGDDAGCRAHRLEAAIDDPEQEEHPIGIREAEDRVDDGRAEQAQRNDLLDVAVICDKSVRTFADSDCNEHACPHRAELRCCEARLEHRLLRDAERHAHDVVHAIAEDHGCDSLHARRMIHGFDLGLILDPGLVRSSQEPLEHVIFLLSDNTAAPSGTKTHTHETERFMKRSEEAFHSLRFLAFPPPDNVHYRRNCRAIPPKSGNNQTKFFTFLSFLGQVLI